MSPEVFKCCDNIKTSGFGAKYRKERVILNINFSQVDVEMGGKSSNFSVNYPLNLFSLHFWLPKLVKTNQFWTVSCSAPCNLVSLVIGFEDTKLKITSSG